MTPRIGDLFPKEHKDQQARTMLVKGAVLRGYVPDIRNPKVKRLIIVGAKTKDGKVGKIYINTNQQASHSQILLENNDGREYLAHDTYVDCSEVYEEDYEEMVAALSKDFDRYLGNVSDKDMDLIEATIRACKTISPNKKKRFGIM